MRVMINAKKPRLLVVQRISLSNSQLTSRSIGARFGPLLNYMSDKNYLSWSQVIENDINLNMIKGFDAVLLNKHSSRSGLDIIENASSLGLKTIYDLDDWILDLPSYSVTSLNEDVISNIVAMIRGADYVTVSNSLLHEKLKYIRPDSIILKNGFNHESITYSPEFNKESEIPKILFSNTDGIKLISYRNEYFEQLIQFMDNHPEAEIDFWGDQFPEMHNIPRLNNRGFKTNAVYKESIRDMGYWFAIVPLGGAEDSETLLFNSCKSCIKYIDYGSLGIPGIYSNTPVYSDVVDNEVTGCLVSNQDSNWIHGMEKLYHSKDLRQKIRVNAYNDCVKNYGLRESAKKLLSLIE